MNDHDPLALQAHDTLCPRRDSAHAWCYCPLLARARVDERERIAQAIEATAVMPRGAVTAARFFALGAAARIARNGGNP